MKKLLFILFIIPLIAVGQVPQGINYQAVAYDANGFELSNKEVGVRISIVEGSAFGTPQLVEEHDVITTEQGLFSLTIGQGALLGGEVESLLDIPWGSNTYFLKIELDTENNGSYMDFGTQQFMSVPYALYAESSGTPGPEGPEGPEGEPGNHGLNCWDVNSNGLNDLEEDTNNDGEFNALDCMWVLSNSSSSPLGVILPYAASTAPEGWMICDGSEISRDEYTHLFSLIDTTYGPGNGSTTFNIPNLSGRVPVGKDLDGNILSNALSLGNIGGDQQHSLSVEELPNISLYLGAPNNNSMSGQDYPSYINTNSSPWTISSYSAMQPGNPSPSWVELVSNAGNQPHNNMQPYLITNYIIRVVDEANPIIDGVSQIPPLEEILQLQYKVDSLEEVLSNDNYIGFTKIEANEHDSIYIAALPDNPIILTGQISAYGGSCYPQGISIDIIFVNEDLNKENNIKGGGWLMPIENGSSLSNSNKFIPLDDFPNTYSGWSRKFYYEFEVSHPMEIIIYSNGTCGSSSYTIQY